MKKTTSNYETTQLLNVQIESVDRKMRSIAIKRSENMHVNIEDFIKIQNVEVEYRPICFIFKSES